MTRRTLTTNATGRRRARPELATLDVEAIGEGDTAAAARETARDRAATVRESLQGTVSDERIRTVELEVADSSELFEPDVDAAYRATETLAVDCALESALDVVVLATDAGGTVPSVRFELDEDVRRRLQEEALAEATKRAREKAERIASTEGLTVADVRDVTVQADGGETSSIVEAAIAASSDAVLRPDPISVTETVTVVYELAEERS